MEKPDNHISHLRGIRSFVLRQGHLSAAQTRAIEMGMPVWGVDYQSKQLDWHTLFGRNNPKILEIGFGMGDATAQIAQRLPEYDFIGVEVHSPGVGNLLKLIAENDITNIRIIRHDANDVIQHMIADGTLAGVHIFFPDPWPKKRHHKRRLIQANFIDTLLPKIAEDGYIHLATDWQEYAEQMLEVLTANPHLHNRSQDYAPTPDYRVQTKFEARGKKLGHGVWDLIFDKKMENPL